MPKRGCKRGLWRGWRSSRHYRRFTPSPCHRGATSRCSQPWAAWHSRPTKLATYNTTQLQVIVIEAQITNMREKIFSYAQFDVDALLSIAEKLRGRTCTCDRSTGPKTGSMNWVIFVTFEDGLDWVFHSPRNGHGAIVSKESAQKMLLSEVATLNFLRKQTSVPVPEVYSFRFVMVVSRQT